MFFLLPKSIFGEGLVLPSLGMPELILILVIAMVIFGPKKLPEMGKSLGKTMNEFRRASASGLDEVNVITKEIKDEVQQVASVIQNKPN